MSYVVLECGSAARGDSNKNSDRDIVCIWNGKAPNYTRITEEHGETIFYSIESIDKMREKGSLFLTHLDIDSKYITGDVKLTNSFSGYRPPKALVKSNLLDTVCFIKSIGWYPDTMLGHFWLCDVLYVSLRNFLFCQNALNDNYLFGYKNALRNFNLSARETSIMLLLRNAKYLFRNGGISDIYAPDIEDIEIACRKILGQPVFFKSGGATHWDGKWRRDYWGERLIERAIINDEHSDNAFLKRLRKHNYNRFILQFNLGRILKEKQNHV
ncbi:hypothetical protein [Pantoea endophytica]